MISGAVEADAITRYTLVQIDERVGAKDETTADGFIDGNSLESVEGKIRYRPDDGVDALLDVEGDSDHSTRVIADGDSAGE